VFAPIEPLSRLLALVGLLKLRKPFMTRCLEIQKLTQLSAPAFLPAKTCQSSHDGSAHTQCSPGTILVGVKFHPLIEQDIFNDRNPTNPVVQVLVGTFVCSKAAYFIKGMKKISNQQDDGKPERWRYVRFIPSIILFDF